MSKFIASAEVPKRAPRRPVPRNLDPFVSDLAERWSAGCHNARKLFEEVRQLGYTGSDSAVRLVVRPWRTAERTAEKQGIQQRRYVWKEVRWSILCPAEHLRTEQRQCLQELLALHPQLATAYELLQRFRRLLHEHQVDGFGGWLHDAAVCGLAPFERLARTLTSDRAAVRAAIELPWSTGPVEGIITRIKLIKRIGYGWAGLDLLRASFFMPARKTGEWQAWHCLSL